MNGFARGPVLNQNKEKNSHKAYFINVLEYSIHDSVVPCPPFHILYPTRKTPLDKKTPRGDCFTKNQNCAVPSCQLEVIVLTALPLLRCGS